MLERILVAVLVKLGSYLLGKALEHFQRQNEQKADDRTIDQRVEKVREVLKEALDGTPVTPEQKERFKASLRDLIRGGASSGL